MARVTESFGRFARRVSTWTGSPWAALAAVLLVAGWFVAGLVVGFTDTMQLIINTGTTIITFLMVFLIQNSQNRDTAALHLKLDELLRAVSGARTEVARAEDMAQEEVERAIREIKEEGA